MRILLAVWGWFDERTGIGNLIAPALRHPVPPESASLRRGWMYLFGIATLASFINQVITGIALATLYVPSTANAYDSLDFITNHATLGSVLRGMHYWGASAMILFVGIHMIRVFLTGSFKFPREVNWMSGVLLLILTVAMGFTGQILRWDQNGVWSIFIAVEQAGRFPLVGAWIGRFLLGGNTVSAATLSRFFAYHVFFIPGLIFAVVGFHLYLVEHNGISELPRIGRPVDKRSYRAWYRQFVEEHGVPYFPDAAWHEIAFAVLLIIAVLLIAIFVGPPPLLAPPDPANVIASPRPDWYLLWYFALLALLRPAFENYFIILAPLFGFGLLFLMPLLPQTIERSPLRRPWAPAIVILVVVGIGGFWHYGSSSPWAPRFDAHPLSMQQIGVSSGPVADGAALFYNAGCEYCHTVDGQGGQRGPDLTHVAERMSSGQIAAWIADGGGNMPAFVNSLTPVQVQDLIAFLESQSSQGTAATAAQSP